jgi:kinesin family member 4
MTNDNGKSIPVKVALRIRPLMAREKADACNECLRTIAREQQVILGKDKAFTYDYLFTQQTPQIEVYENAVQPLLTSLFNGYNATVLAYGQTGSGKTYTMGSSYSSLVAANASLNSNELDEVGVIPRVLRDLFQRIDEKQASTDIKFTVRVSYVEVYKEEIKDLLNTKPSSMNESLNIREENNNIWVVNLSEIIVPDAAVTIQLLERGSSCRVVGGTAMNEQSSRSHAIFTITLEQQHGENELIKSKFHLVDLAGSERQSKTKAEGLRLKEGININLGLLALGNVISVLGEDAPSNKIKHVPYRESKLTRLLQDSLGGNSHTLMIACVSPADSNMEETLNTLRYADRARKIKNKPIVNIDPQAAEMANLRQQVQSLKAHILQLTGGTNYKSATTSSGYPDQTAETQSLHDDNQRLKNENIKLLAELQRIIATNAITYERLMRSEAEKEELLKKFEEIKLAFVKVNTQSENKNQNDNGSMISNKESPNKTELFSELQSKLGEFEKLRDNEEQATVTLMETSSDQSEPVDKDYAFRQAKMQVQLNDYDTELAKKEQLHKRMLENIMSSYGCCTPVVGDMDELKSRIETLEREKEELQDMLRNSSDNRKLGEQKRDRLKQLESEVLDLKRKEKELQKMMKIKEENEKLCEKLRQEIQHIKQERVKLIKQMRSDTEQFRKYKQEKEKEVSQLKALERKRLVEISKLQEGNNRQEQVLKRKNEEISRIQRQLRDTFEKQKQVAEKRQQAFDRKESSTLGDKLRAWISQEVELSVGLAEARINLNKLIDERKECAVELARLNDKLTELNTENPLMPLVPLAKRKNLESDAGNTPGCMDSTYIARPAIATNMDDDEAHINKAHIQQRIERIAEEIEGKNVQINEIQQMVIEGDAGNKKSFHFDYFSFKICLKK